MNLSTSVELPQLHRVLHIVHVARDQLVPCYTCSPLKHILSFLCSSIATFSRSDTLKKLSVKLCESHLNQIHPIGLCRLLQVNGYQSVVLSILVGVKDSLGPLVGHVVVVGVVLGDDFCQRELALDPLLPSRLLLQVGEVEQVVLAVLRGQNKEVP